MTTARSSETSALDAAEVAWERRRRAAWLDYLRATQEADRGQYHSVEGNAWELLQRRLRRNDEIRNDALATRA
ncbi:MAG: hypothetical protein KDC46_02100 [Thermoleophilia bacterium]|nr:hypothetical protein [Thermoleophilia bacterium]